MKTKIIELEQRVDRLESDYKALNERLEKGLDDIFVCYEILSGIDKWMRKISECGARLGDIQDRIHSKFGDLIHEMEIARLKKIGM